MELSFFVFCYLKVNQLETGIVSIFRRENPLERLLIEVVEILAISISLTRILSLSGIVDCLCNFVVRGHGTEVVTADIEGEFEAKL